MRSAGGSTTGWGATLAGGAGGAAGEWKHMEKTLVSFLGTSKTDNVMLCYVQVQTLAAGSPPHAPVFLRRCFKLIKIWEL